jgi:nitroreductase
VPAAPFPDPHPPRPAADCPEDAAEWFDAIGAARWSPYAYDPAPVPDDALRAVFAAAGGAPSSRNEQPWRFVVGRRGEEGYERLLAALAEPNRVWARLAPVLGVAFAATAWAHNGRPNGHARYDTGAAMAVLALAATSRGLQLHQMGGFDAAAAHAAASAPEGFEAVTAFALGRAAAAPPPGFPEPLAARDATRRGRRPLGETVSGGAWGEPLFGEP